MTIPAVRMVEIYKSFGPVRANRGATLEVAAGEIHALVGENGAGKSTLMRILSGLSAPDSGSVEVGGHDVTGWKTADAIAGGVGMVHQHFMLVPTLTVAENVMLGCELTSHGRLDRGRAEREVAALSQRSGLVVAPNRLVSDLAVGEAQRVEILKTLYRGAHVLVLDEPTAVLSPPEVDQLWRVLRALRDSGDTIVLITHRLDEVMDISTTVTVMRHGRTVERLRTSETSPREIARAMVGREVVLGGAEPVFGIGEPAAGNEGRNESHANSAPALLEVRAVSVLNARRIAAVKEVSFRVNAGEILGVAGVEGNGQTELVEAIAGLRPVVSGTILIDDADVTRADVVTRGNAGLSHIPEDRQARGLVLDYSVADNLILGQQRRFANAGGVGVVARERVAGGRLDREKIEANAWQGIERFDIRPPDPRLPARALSGGNQQKIVVAREMARAFRVLIAAQPTRGVDVGAIELIHAQLRNARAAGRAILLVSADLTEILALSDRIAVMYGGRFAAVIGRSEANAEVLGRYMTGAALVA